MHQLHNAVYSWFGHKGSGVSGPLHGHLMQFIPPHYILIDLLFTGIELHCLTSTFTCRV